MAQTTHRTHRMLTRPWWQQVRGVEELVGRSRFAGRADAEEALAYWNETDAYELVSVSDNANDPGDAYWTIARRDRSRWW